MGSRIDPELAALEAGLRPAVRVSVDPEQAEEVAGRFRSRGLPLVWARAPASVGGRPVSLMYVGLTLRDAEAARDAEAGCLPGAQATAPNLEDHRALGIALGFPRCCVDAYCARLARGLEALAEDYLAARDAWVARPHPWLNQLLLACGVRLVTFYPCRYDCASALAYARAVMEAIRGRDEEAARDLGRDLSRAVAIAPSGARALVELAGGAVAGARGALDEHDSRLAAAITGGAVGPDGAIAGSGAPPALVVDFAAGARG
jgi:hypothetical protein